MKESGSNIPMTSSTPSIYNHDKLILDEASTAYRVHGNKTGKKVKREKLLIIAKFHCLLLLFALVVYALPFPVKFLIVKSLIRL